MPDPPPPPRKPPPPPPPRASALGGLALQRPPQPPIAAGQAGAAAPLPAPTAQAPSSLEPSPVVAPASPEPPLAEPSKLVPVHPETQPTPNAKVLLVVEDDASIREIVVRALGGTYTIYTAEDGRDALDVLDRAGVIPNAILSDVMMPHMDGYELAKALRADPRFKSVPLLFLTSRDSPLDVVQGINAGARHYITKPFKMHDLMEKVAKAIK